MLLAPGNHIHVFLIGDIGTLGILGDELIGFFHIETVNEFYNCIDLTILPFEKVLKHDQIVVEMIDGHYEAKKSCIAVRECGMLL